MRGSEFEVVARRFLLSLGTLLGTSFVLVSKVLCLLFVSVCEFKKEEKYSAETDDKVIVQIS